MAENANVDRLREAYAEWDRSKGENAEVWRDLAGEEVSLFSLNAGRTPCDFTRGGRGAAAVESYLSGLREAWKMESAEMTEFIADGDRVVVLGRHRWTNRRTGQTWDTPKCDVWRFRDGKVVEFAEFYDTYGMMAAATGT